MKVIRNIYTPEIVKRVPPVNLKEGDDLFFGEHPYEFSLPESNFFYLNNAIITDIGIVIKNFRALRRFITCYASDFRNYEKKYILKAFLLYKKISTNPEEKYLLGFDNYSGPNGFFHWISEGLTRLVELKETINDYTVIFPEYFQKQPLYRDTIVFFNIKKTFFIPRDAYISVKNLYVCDYIAPSGNFRPQNVKKLQHFIWEKCNVKKESEGLSKIYISRKKAGRRHVENEEEITDLLKSFGFTIICLEDYSFAEQVKLIYNAEYLVSIHGAGLTHLFFMQPGANVLEFRKENDSINFVYFNLANETGVNYYYQFCKGRTIKAAANNFNLIVNAEELANNIKIMFAKHKN